MDINILVFISGVIFGGLVVFITFSLSRKNENNNKEAMMEQMKLCFENTANKVIKAGSSELTEQNKEKLEEFFTRFKDKIEEFQKRAEENFKEETKNFNTFDMNIKSFLEAGNKISQDTSSLVNVMKSDNRTQGRWGEIVLEKVLESSGLRKDEEYKIQQGMSEGRPDATIYLPEGKCVYIDAKTSFASWNNYVNAETEENKEIYLKEFIDSTKSHIAGLAKRDYSNDEMSPDYVLMFIPIEGCYSLMFCDDCELWNLAWKNNIMPVSPSTLLAALKIINAFYVVDRQNKNTVEVSRLCASMIDKFASLLEELLKIRKNLDTSLKKLNGTGNIINQIKKIEKLGGIITSKEIPELPNDLQDDLIE